jgi:hypothetical protein
MADRQAGGARASDRARRRSGPPRRVPLESLLGDLRGSRPPCSVAERELADVVGRRMRAAGLRTSLEPTRAPTSPTWSPLLRALLRVWAAAFLAAGSDVATQALATASIVGGVPLVAGWLRFVPLLGARTANIVALRRGRDGDARPVVVVAHLDTHATGGSPMNRLHAVICAASGWLVLVTAVLGRPGSSSWRPIAALVAFESVLTLAWLAFHELQTSRTPPDDNTSGVLGLIRTCELIADETPPRDVWLVGTAAGTSGSFGIASFLRARPELAGAWVVEIDALGSGEIVASPLAARIPYPGTPPALVRAVAAAAGAADDPLTVRRVYRPHSDARRALRSRVAAIVLTGGIKPPAGGGRSPDPANAERCARVVNRLVRADH